MNERLVTFASGTGRTFENNARAIQRGLINGIEMAGLVVSSINVEAIEKAKNLKIPWVVVDRKNFFDGDFFNEDDFARALDKAVREFGGTFVSQNGWMIKTPKNFIKLWENVIFNQHPGPKYETRATKGRQPHAIMLDVVAKTGRNEGTHVIIHRVNENWDSGETVGLRHVPIYEGDTVAILQERAFIEECNLQIEHWNRFVNRDVQKVDENLYIREGEEKMLSDIVRQARKDFPNG